MDGSSSSFLQAVKATASPRAAKRTLRVKGVFMFMVVIEFSEVLLRWPV